MGVTHLDRRLLAILAVDVVGYSAKMEVDEVGTISRLKEVRRDIAEPLIAEHHGRILKLMGDGALVTFESVVDAVSCAMAIQRKMTTRNAPLPEVERIVFRTGVNLGDVALVDGDIYGDGVNVPPDWSSFVPLVESWCPARPMISCRAKSTRRLILSVISRSRTLLDLFAPIRCDCRETVHRSVLHVPYGRAS